MQARVTGSARTEGTSDAFRIPAAVDVRGRLVRPAEATKRATYRCPACGGVVDLHAGEKKRRHFHHRAGACSSESVIHLTAKRLVAEAVAEWIDGATSAPVFVRRCAHAGCEETTRQAMPPKVGRAAVEHRLASGHVVDVALLARAAEIPIAAIEILYTHAVDDVKAIDLPLPWVELDAAQVVAAGGRVLVAVRDRLLPWLCGAHATTRGKDARRQRDDRARLRAIGARLGYRLDEFPGFRVARVTTCARGHEALVFEWDGREPPWPRPPHVVACEEALDVAYQRAKGWTKLLPYRRRWASACPTCGERVG